MKRSFNVLKQDDYLLKNKGLSAAIPLYKQKK